MIRDLLVHVDGGQAGRGRVKFATELAIRLGARLTGIHVKPPTEVPPLYKPSLVETVAADIDLKLALNAEVAATVFVEEATERLADAPWFEIEGDEATEICKRTRYADLVILGQCERQGSPEVHPLPVAYSVVLQCGRPVLVVPALARPNLLAKIAVAWDGSREAVRAVHDALPLFRLAHSVQILTIISPSSEHNDVDAQSLLEHLAKHGIEKNIDTIQIRTNHEHDSLRNKIDEGDYDLVVMGGYSHPRWIEFIFGGATQSILLSSKIPVLISH